VEENTLQKHVFSTYLTLRYGIAIIGALLPVLVYAVGAAKGVPLQNSISAYYWAPDGQNAPSRNWFVGCLFVVAAFLYLYKGFSKAENFALNLAAILALGVAVFPMEWNCVTDCGKFSLHGFCAVSMFACLVYVVWFRARDTLSLVPLDAKPSPDSYRKMYAAIGFVMLASPLTAFVFNSLIGTQSTYIFFIEAAGIWAFSLYWFTKSSELKKSAATALALHARIETQPSRSTASPTHAPGSDVVEEANGERKVGNLKG
jgi:hypothetical protein